MTTITFYCRMHLMLFYNFKIFDGSRIGADSNDHLEYYYGL